MSGSNRDTWRPTLEGAAKMAPTGDPPRITAEEFRGKGRKAAMTYWPTPTAMASARNATSSRKPDSEHHAGTTLLDAVWDQEFSGSPPTSGGGQLNPTWVEWLMGFPPGWTDLGDSETP